MSFLKNAVLEVVRRVKRNPVLVGGSALVAYEAFTSGTPITLVSGITIIVAFLVRSQVVPANEVDAILDGVHQLGFYAGEAVAKADAIVAEARRDLPPPTPPAP